ncbi:hypothetical protein [Zhihengliuella halotolerans]|uniref:hypothetical protein n=1 Tax=Zhihengliuella halotolerans TaxID=370736 RepID=UPI000C808734|nr:hypothetical protein [Zhihengliuella halotolerans]
MPEETTYPVRTDAGRGGLLAVAGVVLLLAPAWFLLNVFFAVQADPAAESNAPAWMLVVPAMVLSLLGLVVAAFGVRRVASSRLSAIVQTCCYAVPVAIVVVGCLVDLHATYVAEYDGGFGGLVIVYAGCVLQAVLAVVAFTTATYVYAAARRPRVRP